MLSTTEAEADLDAFPHLKLDKQKEKYSAVYSTANGRQLALERRSKTAKIFVENVIDFAALPFSRSTAVEHFPPTRPRVHLPAPRLAGPYKGRAGADAFLIRLGTKNDLVLLLQAYGDSNTSNPARPIPPSDALDALGTVVQDEDEESAFAEGAAAYRTHRALERDPALARRAKARRLAETGSLACEVCAFDFLSTYGLLGNGFIEAHHIKPVSSLDGTTRTKLSDLSLVCSNCHRMLHRSELLTPAELKQRLIEGT
jgi:hypothetical protein